VVPGRLRFGGLDTRPSAGHLPYVDSDTLRARQQPLKDRYRA